MCSWAMVIELNRVHTHSCVYYIQIQTDKDNRKRRLELRREVLGAYRKNCRVGRIKLM